MIDKDDNRDTRNNGVALYIMERPHEDVLGNWRLVGHTGRPGFNHFPPKDRDFPDGYAVGVPLFPDRLFPQ